MTEVKNKYKEKYDVYIGRPTIYGNPFEIGRDGDRDEVIEKYREYFERRIETDDEFLQQVMFLKDKKLGCFCKPQKCHGDIICEFLNRV